MKRHIDNCMCWRCKRILPHRGEGVSRCDCGAAIGEPGTVQLCAPDLFALSIVAFEAHVDARERLERSR